MNNRMTSNVATQLIKTVLKGHIHLDSSRILVMEIKFKERCTDFRNTRIVDLVKDLAKYNAKVDIYYACADPVKVEQE